MTESPNDEEFAESALSGLAPVEPSPHLLRRVAQVPLEYPRERGGAAWWSVLTAWPARALVLGALIFGAAVGGLPWLDDSIGGQSTAGAVAEAELGMDEEEDANAPQSDESAELEGALSLALGSDWLNVDAALEESL